MFESFLNFSVNKKRSFFYFIKYNIALYQKIYFSLPLSVKNEYIFEWIPCKTNRSKKDWPVLDTMSMVFSTSAAVHWWQQCNLPIPQCSWMHPVSTIHPNRSMGMNIYWLVVWDGPLGSLLDVDVYLLRLQAHPILPASMRQIIVFRMARVTWQVSWHQHDESFQYQ